MKMLRNLSMLIALALLPASLAAQEVPPVAPTSTPVAEAPAATAAAAATPTAAEAPAASDAAAEGAYTPMDASTAEVVGKPVDKGIDFQPQYSEMGKEAHWINNAILLPIIFAISLFVLGLLSWVIVRYNRRANPVPSKTTHNTLIEIIWTAVPVLILIVIAIPSLGLIAKQFKPAPENAVTVKATGYQWYWTYSYPDHGGFEITSNMLQEEGVAPKGEKFRTDADGPAQLAVDNRMVVPVGVPIRLQTTAADVIHSFAVPSLWFKLDAVPGRLNEKQLIIEKPGIYFGQCSELCGARHGFMPIAVEALPPAQFAAWVKAKGGKMPEEIKAEAEAKAAADKAAAEKAKADEAAKAAAAPAATAAPAGEDKAAPAAATN